MTQWTRILVPLDGTPASHGALPLAAQLARAARASLLLLRVVPISELDSERLARAEAYLGQVAQAPILRDVTVEATVAFGEPDEQILPEALAAGCSLIVLVTQKKGLTRLLLGSVATRLLQQSPIPVAVIHADQNLSTSTQRIVVPLDGASTSREILPLATEFAQLLGAELVLLRVVDLPSPPTGRLSPGTIDALASRQTIEASEELHSIQAELASQGLQARVLLRGGAVAPAIIRTVAEEEAGLIAMATRGRGAMGRALLGSVADEVIHAAHVPVVVVSLAGRRAGAEHEPATARRQRGRS